MDGFRLVAALLIGLAGRAAQVAPAPAADSQSPENFRISVNVRLVVLNATVRDPKGQVASNLREQDFEIYEDGVRQAIRLFQYEDVPVTVGLVVDHSGSMRQKLPEVIAAARVFVQSSSPADQMFVVNFNERASLGLSGKLQFSNRADELAFAIANTPAAGRTALYDAIALARERAGTGGPDKKVLIVISDGGDNASRRTLREVLVMAQHSNYLMYTIGIFDADDPDRNPGVLKRLAHATGGEAYFPAQLSDIITTCERIARDIRHQYTIGYVSTNAAQTGAYRKIHVVARAPGKGKLEVLTRAGYVAGEDAK